MSDEAAFVFVLIGVAAALMASNKVRFDIVALLVLLSLMLSGVLTVDEVLSGFGSSVVILVAGLLIIGEMLSRTGVARAMGDWILKKGGTDETRLLILIVALTLFDVVPLVAAVIMAALAAVLVAPIAIYTAKLLEVSPYPFAVAVLIAASAAYTTPISTPVVTLVVDPGRYKFSDFVKVGVPLLFLTYLVTLVTAPLIFPFYPS